jgi:hypothetical protein
VPLAQRAKGIVHGREHGIAYGGDQVAVGRSGLHGDDEVRDQTMRAKAPTAAFREKPGRRFDGTGDTHHGQTRVGVSHSSPIPRSFFARGQTPGGPLCELRKKASGGGQYECDGSPQQQGRACGNPPPSVCQKALLAFGRRRPSQQERSNFCRTFFLVVLHDGSFDVNGNAQTNADSALSENVPPRRSRSPFVSRIRGGKVLHGSVQNRRHSAACEMPRDSTLIQRAHLRRHN